MRETRQQLKDRLKATGCWPEYLALRERLTRDGLTPAQAREEALAQLESRPPQSATANPPSVNDGEQNKSDHSRLVIDIPHIERIAWEHAAKTSELPLSEWIRGRCGHVTAKPPYPPNPDGLCLRCMRLGSDGCPNCPKNLALARSLSPQQILSLQGALRDALGREEELRKRLKELEANGAAKSTA